MQLKDAYAALLAGTHVLVQHDSEAEISPRIVVVPKAEFDRWKEAIKAGVQHGEWPDEINDSLETHLADAAVLQIDRWINTTGDSWGIGDGPDAHHRDDVRADEDE